MSWFWWIVGVAASVGFVRLVARRIRKDRQTPGVPTTVQTSTHDEPLEDTAKPVDAEHHPALSADEEARGYRDIRRSLGV